MTTNNRDNIIARLKEVESKIAEVRRICGWPEHEATRPRFSYGDKRFKLTNSNSLFRYTEAEIRPYELASRFMLELAYEFRDSLTDLHILVERSLDPALLTAADVHLDLARGRLFTFLLTPNNPDAPRYNEAIHWLAQYELAGEWDYLTCVYLKNSEVLTVPLSDLAEKIAKTFNEVMINNLEP